ncbi:MAG: hypothetical protein AVDCRST_MAG12-2993, partial [uncultured Rubrobacteraceae bacterium]
GRGRVAEGLEVGGVRAEGAAAPANPPASALPLCGCAL